MVTSQLDLVVKNERTPEQFTASIAEEIYDQSKIPTGSQKGRMAFVDAELMDTPQTYWTPLMLSTFMLTYTSNT